MACRLARCSVDPRERRPQRLAIEDVGLDDLTADVLQILGTIGIAREGTNMPTFIAQTPAKQPTDVAGAPSNGNHPSKLAGGSFLSRISRR